MDDILEFLYDLLPPWLATTIAGMLSLIVGIVGTLWHAHEQTQLALCNSTRGELSQLVNGAAHASCGASSLLSDVALVLEIGGYGLLAVFVIVFAVLAAKGKLRSIEA